MLRTRQDKTRQNKLIRFCGALIFLFSTILFHSCENEIQNINPSNVGGENLKDEVSIKNGRLFFQSKETLVRIYQKYADASDEKISAFLQPFYEAGFYSLRPIVTEKNEEFLYNHYNKLIKKEILYKKSASKTNLKTSAAVLDAYDYMDELEDVIGDDTFASFLNTSAEIQVGTEIYKYTDVGLFISEEDKYTVLEDYLDLNEISNDLMIETSSVVKTNILAEYPLDGISIINEDLTYFKMQPIDDPYSEGGSIIYTPASNSVVSSDPSYASFLSNLSTCDPHSGIFGNLFGDNDVCIDKYETRRRVKTKSFNYNYLLVYHLGVKCVNQYKGWTGFWRVEATDEIRLVVEAAQFEYDLDALLGNNAINNLTRERAYFMNNQKAFFVGPNSITFNDQWGQPILTYVDQTSLPQIFQDDLTFEFFGTGNSWLDGQIQNGIDSNLKATNLNDWFYNGLYSQVKTQLQSAFGSTTLPPDNRTLVAKFPQNGKMIIQKSVNSKGFNIGVRERTFDWGVQFCFSGGGSDWQIQPDMACNILVKPKNFKVKIIGAARHGNDWHGSKFTDGID